MGLLRPRLLLPIELRPRLSDEELRFVFLHELAHLKRHDIAIDWCLAILQTLHWFNPLIALAFARARGQRELARDAMVLAATAPTQQNSYGQTIVKLVESFARIGSILFEERAVLALAIGTMVRRSAVAVTAVIVVIVAPYILSTFLSNGATQWLLRVTPAAGFAIQGAYPRYPQITVSSSALGGGYYPLAPWAGLAVLTGWAAAALALAVFLLRRRDA